MQKLLVALFMSVFFTSRLVCVFFSYVERIIHPGLICGSSAFRAKATAEAVIHNYSYFHIVFGNFTACIFHRGHQEFCFFAGAVWSDMVTSLLTAV